MGGVLTAIKSLPKVAVKTLGKISFSIGKNKPTILLVGGIIITSGSFIWAMSNARKLDDMIAETSAKVDDIQQKKTEAENPENELFSEEERNSIIATCNKELSQARWQSALKIFLLLGVPCIAFIGGLMLIIGGHVVIVRRFGELSAAFATLQETFNKYRQMNIAEHGEECDRRYRYGIVGEKKINATITDDDGKEKKIKASLPIVDPEGGASMYKFVFDEYSSSKCPRDPVNTISFLRNQEVYWNTWMQTKHKPVTLYMVLEELGIDIDCDDPRMDYIMIAGWRPNGDGDNHIDFGIMRAINQPTLSAEENTVFLEFNCDGNLYHSPRYSKDKGRVK